MPMANPFASNGFKKRQAEWYLKLKRQGFDDIEGLDGELIDQKSVADDLRRRVHFKSDLFEINESYWSWAADALYHATFKSARDKRIWAMHAEGLSCADIAGKIRLERSWISRKLVKIARYIKVQEYPIRSVLPYILAE